jgi:hypothetical protein
MEAIGPELQAQVHHWRAASAAARGDDEAAQRDRREAVRILATVEKNVPDSLRPRFLLRPEVQAIGR